jgi:hypothetical protein
MFGPLEGARVDGGCEHCDAYQTVEAVKAGVWRLTVHHDPGCKRLGLIRRCEAK